ncbi:MAG: hypothetical protein UHI85_03965, partial [Turicibacter sp.]|nr:hypothetical protein [Turicibacter sp.]
NESDTFAIQQVTVTNHVLSTSSKYKINQEEENNQTYDEGFEEGYKAGYQAAIEVLGHQVEEITK